MVTILKYVFLGILIYSAIIPILDEVVVVIVQGLELLKGKLLLKATQIQTELNNLVEEEDEEKVATHAIGFQLPEEVYYEEEDDEEDE